MVQGMKWEKLVLLTWKAMRSKSNLLLQGNQIDLLFFFFFFTQETKKKEISPQEMSYIYSFLDFLST